MKKPKKKLTNWLTNRDVDFMLFECEMHRLLDLLCAPPGKYLVKRLREHLESKGIDTSWEAEIKMRGDDGMETCAGCGARFRRGLVCGYCYGRR